MTGVLLHSVSDAARMLGIGRTLFYQLVGEGKLRTVKLGGKTMVADAEIRRFVDELVKEAAK